MEPNVRSIVPNGAKIRELRRAKGFTQDDLVERCIDANSQMPTLGCSLRTLQQAERGVSVALRSLRCIAVALDVPIDAIRAAPPGERAPATTMTDPGDEVIGLIRAARCEVSRDRARDLLRSAVEKAKAWTEPDAGSEPVIWRSHALCDLAQEEDDPRRRASLWREGLDLLAATTAAGDADVADEYARSAVQCFQDVYADMPRADRCSIIRNAKGFLDSVIGQEADPEEKGLLLARKSSVLRMVALTEYRKQRETRLCESVACARKAISQADTAFVALELGAACWAFARTQRSDRDYAALLREAEKQMGDPRAAGAESAILGRARFYRLTFRPLEACELWLGLLRRPRNLRRVLRDSYVYGESAALLWRSGYPPELVRRHCSEAIACMEMAVAAGYCTARMVIDLAFAKAILEGADAGSIVLCDLHRDRRCLDWGQLIQQIISKGSASLVDEGFALGVTDSAALTRLGTFFSTFLKDAVIAEQLYRCACRLDRCNAVALTDLARLLVASHNPAARTEARRLLDQAREFADRRFFWWRSVLSWLNQLEGKVGGSARRAAACSMDLPLDDLSEAAGRFAVIEALPTARERGAAMTRLFSEIASLASGIAKSSWRLGGTADAPTVRASLVFRGHRCAVSTIWDDHAATSAQVEAFAATLAESAAGVLISMKGFEESATSMPKRRGPMVLLVDGEEVRDLVHRHMVIDEMLLKKIVFFERCGERFHPVRPLEGVSLQWSS